MTPCLRHLHLPGHCVTTDTNCGPTLQLYHLASPENTWGVFKPKHDGDFLQKWDTFHHLSNM